MNYSGTNALTGDGKNGAKTIKPSGLKVNGKHAAFVLAPSIYQVFLCAVRPLQIRHPDDETHCKLCKLGTLPDAHKQYCRPIPEIYLRPESAWAIGAMAFSATGILVTLFVMGVFVR